MVAPLLLATALAAGPVHAVSPARADTTRGEVYSGLEGHTEVRLPRLDSTPVVDGVLDEAAWREAARLTGFSQYRPVDGIPAEDRTEVLLWYSSSALHVGIRAWEPHAAVNATHADRDAIFGDDHVQILLDTFDDRRRAMVFAVNPVGVQADGVHLDEERNRGFFSAEAAEGGRLDLSPDFVFESRGRITAEGYEVELRIPFESLRFQDAETQRWGINVVREVQHAGQTQTWTRVRRGATSFLAQSGAVVGLEGLDPGLVMDLNPVLTQQVRGAPGSDGWAYRDGGTEVGLNARWGITPNLTANATANPDFSQVEADVAQIQFDPRASVFFPERRPFFLEGSENFAVPNGLIHTRSIVDPVAAAKVGGKVGGFAVGLLSALDATGISASGEDHPVVNLLRLRRDVGAESYAGLTWTDRVEGGDYNRVGSVDGRVVLGPYAVTLQGAGSVTRAAGARTTGWLWDARVERTGRSWGWTASVRGIDADFIPGSGFIRRRGVAYASVSPRLTFFGDPGDLVESWSTAVSFNNTWLYDRFTGGEARPDELKLHFNNTFALRGGWQAGVSLLLENFLYPAYLYTDYAVERRVGTRVDTVAFTGTPSINNYDVVMTLSTPSWPSFSANGFLVLGRDENFPEWAPGYIAWTELEMDWRPTGRLRVSPLYSETRVVRPEDWTVVQLTRIPRVKVEYQLARPLFVRLVSQYVSFFQDELRDASRTGDPILLRNPATGVYERSTERNSNELRMDALVAFEPNPGTVVFLGYGSSLDETRAFRFGDLDRSADAFFVKLSYLFRL